MKIPTNIFITAKDIQTLSGYRTLHTACRELRLIKDSLGKKGHQKVTIGEYSMYHGIDKQEVLDALNR